MGKTLFLGVEVDPVVQEVLANLAQRNEGHLQGLGVKGFECLGTVDRPFSTLARVKVETEGTYRNIIIKIFKPKGKTAQDLQTAQERMRREYELTALLHERFREFPGFSTTRPIAHFPDFLTLVMEESPGQSFGSVLEKRARFYPGSRTIGELVHGCTSCGEWLKIFQHVTADREAEPFTLDAMVDYIDIRLKQLVDHPSFSQALRGQILKYFEKQRSRIPPSDYTQVRIHADFCPGNVLIQDRQITVIDFNMTQHGSKYHDLAHFYHQLGLLLVKPIYRPSIIGDLQHALIRGYDNGLHEGAPLFLLCRIQHAICGMARLVTLQNCPIYERLYNKLVFQRQLQWLNGLVTME